MNPGISTVTSPTGLKTNCKTTDKASAALVKDLKQRGLLEDTLVIWGGEFGRTPMVQGGNDGRDHHPNCFTMWMAGGGVKPGLTLGQSDEFGFNATEDKVHVHDLHATLLHLLGFDHTKLTYRFQGRDFRLTDVHGEVVDEAAGVTATFRLPARWCPRVGERFTSFLISKFNPSFTAHGKGSGRGHPHRYWIAAGVEGRESLQDARVSEWRAHVAAVE